MNRRKVIAALGAATVALGTSAEASARPAMGTEGWLARLDDDLKRIRAWRPEARILQALQQAGLPGSFFGEVSAARALGAFWHTLSPTQRSEAELQERVAATEHRFGQLMALQARWLDRRTRTERRAIRSRLRQSRHATDAVKAITPAIPDLQVLQIDVAEEGRAIASLRMHGQRSGEDPVQQMISVVDQHARRRGTTRSALGSGLLRRPGLPQSIDVTGGILLITLAPGVCIVGLVIMLGGYISLGAMVAFIAAPVLVVIGLAVIVVTLKSPTEHGRQSLEGPVTRAAVHRGPLPDQSTNAPAGPPRDVFR
jgi:hypothetical protein